MWWVNLSYSKTWTKTWTLFCNIAAKRVGQWCCAFYQPRLNLSCYKSGFKLREYRLLRLCANGRNNSQHCCTNNVGSCCVRVGSGAQTDATTPNKFGTCSASCPCNPCVMSVRGPNIVALRFGDHGTKEKLGVVSWKVWPVSNFAQQHQATCNKVCKRKHHVTSNNVTSVCTGLNG